MSSMTSYSVGRPASAQKVFKGWLLYYQKNQKKLLKELRQNKEFTKHRELNILNEKKLIEINKEFNALYLEWKLGKTSNELRELIIDSMHQYILKLKVQLNLILDKKIMEEERLRAEEERLKIKKEVSKYIQTIEEETFTVITNNNINMKYKTYLYNKEIETILKRIKKYDIDFYVSQKVKFEKLLHKNIEQKLKLFYDNLKLEYGKIKVVAIWTNVYKESLESFKMEDAIKNDPDLMHSIDFLLDQNQISEDMYDQLYRMIQTKVTSVQEQEEKSLEADKIITALEKLNYLVIDDNKEKIVDKLSKYEKVELSVKDKNYKVVVKFNNDNNLLTRFVHVVQNKKDIGRLSTSEKLKDVENMKKWCKHQKGFMEYMNQDGFEIDQRIVEDEESELLYVVDANLKGERQSNYVHKKEGDMHNG